MATRRGGRKRKPPSESLRADRRPSRTHADGVEVQSVTARDRRTEKVWEQTTYPVGRSRRNVVVVVRGGGVAFRVSARDARRSAARRRGAGARATIGARFSFAAPR